MSLVLLMIIRKGEDKFAFGKWASKYFYINKTIIMSKLNYYLLISCRGNDLFLS
ncbi:hypothetical protein AtNW77_Chr2g0242481 [Arabidopsis thaliana]